MTSCCFISRLRVSIPYSLSRIISNMELLAQLYSVFKIISQIMISLLNRILIVQLWTPILPDCMKYER